MNKNLFIFCFLLEVFFCSGQGNSWQWAKSAQGSNSDNSSGITIDPSGNIINVGFFYSPTIVFGSYTLTNTGNYDLFVVKYDASGNVMWATSAGGIYDDVACGVTTDATGNIYVTGYFYSPVLSFPNYSLTNSGAGDCFIIKYSSNGMEQWVNKVGGPGDENGLGITSDPSGNICITGFFQSPVLYLNNDSLTSAGNRDIFVIKYNSGGNLLWAKNAGGSASDAGQGICSDASGNLFVTGLFYSSPCIAGSFNLSSSGSSDAFIIKMDGNGNFLWANSAGGSFNDAAYSVKTDLSGNVCITGGYLSPIFTIATYTFSNTGAFDLFIAKYDGNGNNIWAITAGGGQDDIGYSIDTDTGGNLYVTGHFHSPAITLGNTILSNSGIGDVFVLKSDPSGNILWAESAGGSSDDGGGGIASDASGSVYVTGYYFSSSVTFSGTTLNNSGSDDVFVAKLQSSPTSVTNNANSETDTVVLFPNPARQTFYVKNLSPDSAIQLINSLGEKTQVVFENTRNGIVVTVENPVPGIYSLIITRKDKTTFNKLVIQ